MIFPIIPSYSIFTFVVMSNAVHLVLERLNFRQNGQVDSKKHKFSSKPLKKLISGFTPEVIYKIRKNIT
jgi:hypothetical protein